MSGQRLVGVVLAGGCSSRMGREKALLMDNGRTFVEAAVEALSAVCRDVVVCASARNAQPLARLGAARVLVDERPELGPLMGVVCGLREARGGDCLFAPCDMPELTGAELAELLALWPPTASVAAPRLDGRGVRPLPLFCRGTMLLAALERLGSAAAGQRSLSSLLTAPQAALIDVQGDRWRRALTSVDTAEDLAALALRRAQTCLN